MHVSRTAERATFTRKQFQVLRRDTRVLVKEWQQAMRQAECPWAASRRGEMNAAIAEVELPLG